MTDSLSVILVRELEYPDIGSPELDEFIDVVAIESDVGVPEI